MPENNRKNNSAFIAERLNNVLDLRFDICTCPACKKNMLERILSRLPAEFTDIPPQELSALSHQIKIEHQNTFTRAISLSIDETSNDPPHEIKENRNKTLRSIMDRILQERSLDLRHYHIEILKRRMALRIRANQLNSYAAYLEFLTRNPAEYDKLFETMCINVSEFFRDPPVWVTIRYLLENLIRIKNKNGENTLRIWSAGCANGEEPFSLAIMIAELFGKNLKNFSIHIQATDVDRACLNFAQKACYPKKSLVNINPGQLNRYFQDRNNQEYQLRQEIKDMVAYSYLDLTSDINLKDIDLITCRNVFIYFDLKLQEDILGKFHKCLRLPGYLVLGKTENLASRMTGEFEEVDASARIYLKK
ncbi:MAG: protein-glutamate O-methyltransferase CheR [Candidatus Omnitrophica bacterium]|jgi:chemotaxis methyl-accepting protein methylase|nr:protein-glutamate O-methyltransferase CheR [Candidatus Omnitrophota bacterium]MDD5079299.1 protein-glutamate O-methyltransferase CheR [Candidatus Omnitrophota bacterium]